MIAAFSRYQMMQLSMLREEQSQLMLERMGTMRDSQSGRPKTMWPSSITTEVGLRAADQKVLDRVLSRVEMTTSKTRHPNTMKFTYLSTQSESGSAREKKKKKIEETRRSAGKRDEATRKETATARTAQKAGKEAGSWAQSR